MLFSRKHACQIVEGRRTVLLNVKHPKRREIGRIYAIQIKPKRKGVRPDPPIGRFRVESVRVIALGEITEEDARAAGYQSLAGFKDRWQRGGHLWEPDRLIYRTEIKLIGPALVRRIAA